MLTTEGMSAAKAVEGHRQRAQTAFALVACVASVGVVLLAAAWDNSARRVDERLAGAAIASGTVTASQGAARMQHPRPTVPSVPPSSATTAHLVR